MKMAITMAVVGGMGVAGYMYLKKHPEKMQKMKNLGKDVSKEMYNMLDQTN